jgi:serine/threonine protein kinase/Tfp pilus assembly protein PilF
MVNKRISHYKILEKLDGGGMGIVYKAQDLRLERNVALKLLSPQLSRDEEGKLRFVHEARATSALDHTNICTIYEIDETDDKQMFIAMAFYDGETLREKIDRSPFTVKQAIHIATQVAEGLKKAHHQQIIHRDIKPANIIVTGDGVVKIVDFGLAKLAFKTKLTKTGTIMGTVAYMSPEQIQGEEVDDRTDIWALGVVLYEMISGKNPFRGEYEHAVMYSIMHEQPEPLTVCKTDVSDGLQRVVNTALQKDPNKRYQQIDDLLMDLKILEKEFETDEYSTKKLVSRRRQPSFRVSLVISLIVIIGIALHFGQSIEIKESTFQHVSLNQNRLAVLPLANLSRDKGDEYFVDGMTEELISTLSRITGLRVIARTSVAQYKETTKDIAEIGDELDVTDILEGSVRKSDNKLRITLQLIDAQTQEHRWTQDYDSEFKDIFAIQRMVAQQVAKALSMKLLPEEREQLEKRGTEDIEAYKLYLRGRDKLRYYNENSMRHALEYFEEAIEIDPGYAKAYAGLADCYHNLSNIYLPPKEAMPKAMAAARKALELDNSLAEAHATLGAIKAFYQWDWAAAEEEFKKAIELNPSYTTTRHYYGIYLIVHGRFEESILQLNQAKQLDPLSLSVEMTSDLPYYYGRQFEQAIKKARRIIESEPDFYAPYGILAFSHLQMGKTSEAVMELEEVVELNKGPSFLGYLGRAYAMAGKTNEAQKMLRDLLSRRANGEYIRPDQIALIYIGLGKKDQALQWLEKAYQERIEELILLNVDPLYDSIRSDERFVTLLEKIGLRK